MYAQFYYPPPTEKEKWTQKRQATPCGHMARLSHGAWSAGSPPPESVLTSSMWSCCGLQGAVLCVLSGGLTQERCLWSLITEIQDPRAHNLLYATQWT